MIRANDNHIVIFGDGSEVGDRVEKYCKITICSKAKDLASTLEEGPVDLVLVTNKWVKTVDSIRSNPHQGDIPILIIGKDRKQAETLCESSGCTGYISSSQNPLDLFSKVIQYLSLGNLLSTAKRAYSNL